MCTDSIVDDLVYREVSEEQALEEIINWAQGQAEQAYKDFIKWKEYVEAEE